MFYLTTHSRHFIYGYMASESFKGVQATKCFEEQNRNPSSVLLQVWHLHLSTVVCVILSVGWCI